MTALSEALVAAQARSLAALAKNYVMDAQEKAFFDWAEINDDDGGHVGFSRYYREQARLIGEELKRRGV